MGRVLDSRAVIQDPNIAKRPEVLFANRSSDGPNSGTESLEVWGIVLNQKATCAQVPPVFRKPSVYFLEGAVIDPSCYPFKVVEKVVTLRVNRATDNRGARIESTAR
jgi:hypothetical protein